MVFNGIDKSCLTFLRKRKYFVNFVETSERMAKPELLQLINTLSKKIDQLLAQQNRLQQRIIELETQNNELKAKQVFDSKQLEEARKDVDFLTMSYRLADNPEAIVSARNMVSKLIRTIDNCILLINED